MKKILIILIVTLLFTSCKKSAENIIWEKSYGTGKAAFVKTVGDTGFVSCGETDGKQYLLFTDKNGNKVIEYKPDIAGILTSVYTGNGYFITAGSSGGKLTVAKIDFSGTSVWDSVFNSAYNIDFTSLCGLGNENFLAVGSADPDSSLKASSGLSFIWFDVNGSVAQKRDTDFASSYVAARDVVTDNSGNIYLAITRTGSSEKMKAGVAKFNSDLQKLWEQDLYNNPSYGAASRSILLDDQNNPLVAGRTELQVSSGIENNAFVTRYFPSGDSLQKCYLEYINSGSKVINDGAGQFMVLNMNCLIVNIMDQSMKVKGIIRTFNSCDSKTTDAFGFSMDMTSDGNIIMAGSKGNGYYLAVKSSTALSPV